MPMMIKEYVGYDLEKEAKNMGCTPKKTKSKKTTTKKTPMKPGR